MSQEKLKTEILKLSESCDWDKARKEWALEKVQMSAYHKVCLCGHFPITELCYINNMWTRHKTIVGNCCVNRFFDMKSNNLFTSLKKIKDDPSYSPSQELITFVARNNWVNAWEEDFMNNTRLKRNMSDLQLSQRARINDKIVRKVWKQ